MLSRVADSLYWMSRYLERAEHTCAPDRGQARIHDRAVERGRAQSPGCASSPRCPARSSSSDRSMPSPSPRRWPSTALNPSSLIASLRMARDNARQVREQLSTEVWEHLNRLYLRLQPVTLARSGVHQPGATLPRGAARTAHAAKASPIRRSATAKAGISSNSAAISSAPSSSAACSICISAPAVAARPRNISTGWCC